MVKPHNRTIGVIVILLMLGASPLSVTYSFADIEENQEDKKGQNDPKSENSKKTKLGAILTEKVVNGKLKVQHYALPDNTTEEDMQRIISFEGQISGWAYVNANSYNSGIVLFDGKASKIGENLWEISANDVLNLRERQFDPELSEKSKESLVMHENASDGLIYKVIFSGESEIDEENVFAISLMNSGLKNPEIGQNIKFLQFGELTINSEKSIGSNQEFRNSISVI